MLIKIPHSFLMPIQIRILILPQVSLLFTACSSLLSFIFLVSVKGVILFNILNSKVWYWYWYIEIFWEKRYCLASVEMDTDPDPARQVLDVDPDSDP
jgi:hypothetical protein